MTNRRGQMAIFIALIFQVLFVLFAMAINVALVLHDKINLQNATDLAAYYAAERQAEWLNAIAHENYMIRQSYKLLTWRYRVLGTGGIRQNANTNPHPAFAGSQTEDFYRPMALQGAIQDPPICVVHNSLWREIDQQESLCQRPLTAIPPLPKVPNRAPFLPFNAIFSAVANQLREQQATNCSELGAYSWWFGAAILQAFREDQKNRKETIQAFARVLSAQGATDFMDLTGNSSRGGAQKTFEKNLTFSNLQAIDSFDFYNSFGSVRPDQWLSEIQIAPSLVYMDPLDPGANGLDAAACVGQPTLIEILPQRPQARTALVIRFGAAELTAAISADGLGFLPSPLHQFAIGYEKNPWYMAYVGVKAETSPRQIFFPFGTSVKLKARAFAKPFGGRIGPWYERNWAQGELRSTGGGRTDPWMSPRFLNGGMLASPQDPNRRPSYSRFPGDTFGMRSQLAQNGLVGLFTPPNMAVQSSFSYFGLIWQSIKLGAHNDILAYNPVPGAPLSPTNFPQIREFEVAAIAPDLFDTTYYSIEPNFVRHYLSKIRASRVALGIPQSLVLRGDLGSNEALLPNFSVADQMARSAARHRPNAFYFLRNKSNLLTSWAPGDNPFDYSFPDSRFGTCARPDDDTTDDFKVPGSCLASGGRTGYSVKLVSRDALKNGQHPIGGMNSAPSSILNPPPGEW